MHVRATGENTLGGYSEKMVVSERFVIRIAPGADLAGTAPLLCAGITTFSPMQHRKLSPRQRVGVIGLGRLGHIDDARTKMAGQSCSSK